MTLKEWKKKFYPITAKQAARGSVMKALDHSILKWSGLDKKTLKAHGVREEFSTLVDDNGGVLVIESGSCALCQKFVVKNYSCAECPLYEVRGEIRCDNYRREEFDTPYESFVDKGNPRPMQKWLLKAKKMLEAQRTALADIRYRNTIGLGAKNSQIVFAPSQNPTS